jgi:hypothetical protein
MSGQESGFYLPVEREYFRKINVKYGWEQGGQLEGLCVSKSSLGRQQRGWKGGTTVGDVLKEELIYFRGFQWVEDQEEKESGRLQVLVRRQGVGCKSGLYRSKRHGRPTGCKKGQGLKEKAYWCRSKAETKPGPFAWGKARHITLCPSQMRWT